MVREGKFREALDVFKKMQKACGRHTYCKASAEFYVGRCLLELSEYDAALPYLMRSHEALDSLGKTMEAAKVLHAQARVAAEKTDYSKALQLYDHALDVLLTHPDQERHEIFLIYINMAKTLIDLCRYRTAEKNLESAENLLSGKLSPKQQAALDTLRGSIYFELQQYDMAMKHYIAAKNVRSSTGDTRGLAEILNNIGLVYEHQSKYTDAIDNYTQSLKLSQRLGAVAIQSFALNNIGGAYFKLGDYQKARDAYTKALSIRMSRGIDNYTANTLNNIGVLDFYSGDYDSAMKRFQEALRITRKVQSPIFQGWILIDIANVLKEQGELPKARLHLERAIRLGKRIRNPKLEAHARLRMGSLQEYLGDFDSALAQYEKALEIQRSIGNRLWESNTLAETAALLTRNGRPDEARRYYEQALEIKKSIGAPAGELMCNFALFYLEKDRYGRDRSFTDQGREEDMRRASNLIGQAEKHIPSGAKRQLMLLDYVKGRLLLLSDPTASAERFQSLARMAEQANSKRFSFLAQVGLGLAYEKSDRLEDAARAFEAAKDYAEVMRESLPERDRRTFLHGEEILGVKHVLPYEGLARVRLKLGDPGEALKNSEFTKARSFSEHLAGRIPRGASGVPSDVMSKDLELNRRLSALLRQRTKAESSGAHEATAAISTKLAALREEFQAHVARMRRLHPRFAAAKYPDPLETSSLSLKKDEWILSYDVTDLGLLGYLTRGNTLVKAWVKPVTRKELDGLVARFRRPMEQVSAENLMDKLKSFDFDAGKELADLLLGEVLSELPPAQPLTIVPDDSLGLLSFAALVLNRGGEIVVKQGMPQVRGAEFFGVRNPLTYAQSMTALALTGALSDGKRSGRRLLVMADPVFQMQDARIKGRAGSIRLAGGPSKQAPPVEDAAKTYLTFERLPETGRLADELSGLFKGRCDVYTGSDARKTRLLETLAPHLTRYREIVLATHGYFGTNLPGMVEPVLVLSLVPPGTDGYLRMSEVLGLKMNADTVALTACQSGLGRLVSGEGTMGMGRAFQFAGAKSVLMTLWSVAEHSSVELVRCFFAKLKEGRSKIDALQAAQEKIRREGYDHPFFWAPFILVGEAG